MGGGWHILAVALAFSLFAFDFQNWLSWSRRRTLDAADRCFDFTIVVPVYGHPRYFAEREHLRHLIGNVLVALDVRTPEMGEFAAVLEAEGWRVERTRVDVPSPPSLIQAVLDKVTTTYVIRMDADTRPLDDVPSFIGAMKADGADICSTKVRVANPSTQVEKMQDLEYRMAMLSRHFRPWLTSGACFAATTPVLRDILARHSMWFPGEDIETGRIAHALKMRVRHLDMTVVTDAPDTWGGLFMQRRLWWAGSFRHTVVNFDRNVIQLPVWTFYYVALVWVGVYFKWDSLLGYLHPFVIFQTLAFLFAVYAVVTVVANWQVRSWRMILFPPYAFVQSILMPMVGTVYFVMLARRQRYCGRYLFGFRRRALPEVA